MAGAMLNFDHGGRSLGMNLQPSYDCGLDGVLRIAPGIAVLGMKALGIENRTKDWGELIVRGGASSAIMLGALLGTKQAVKRVRPDGSDDHSFPSGHATTAFFTAAIFAKEYGHLSPWYTTAAYGVATSTAMMRRLKDKHWMGDVMAGAGIGIMAAELGYALTDLFYKRPKTQAMDRREWTSSSAGVAMQYILPHAIAGRQNGQQIQSRFGYRTGMVASHFFNRHVGVGGALSITSSAMEVKVGENLYKQAEEPLDHVTMTFGPHVALPLGKAFHTGLHLHGGYGFYPQSKLAGIEIDAGHGWGCEGGVSLGYTTRKQVKLELSAHYLKWEGAADWIDNQGLSFGISAGWGW